MKYETCRITESKVTDVKNFRAGPLAKELMCELMHNYTWKRKPRNDEAGDDHKWKVLWKRLLCPLRTVIQGRLLRIRFLLLIE